MSAATFFATSQTVLLDDAAQFAYFASALPSPEDGAITRLVEAYRADAPAERAKIAAGLSLTQANCLGTYAHRMAVLSVRKRSEATLRNGIAALLTAAKVTDPRETTMTLAVMYRAAERLGQGDAAFQAAAADAPDAEVERLLLGFLARAAPDKTIEAMGFRELTGPNGFVIVYGTQPVPASW